MLAAVVTYTDLTGDAPRVEVFGTRFMDGHPVEIPAGAMPLTLLRKLEQNPFFEVLIEEAAEAEEAAEPKKRGRPRKEEKEGGE